MPPTKRRQKDIRFFLRKDSDRPGTSRDTSQFGAAASETVRGCQMRAKEENGSDSVGQHSHHFIVKFRRNDLKEYNISCDQPRTVLEVIKSDDIYKKMNKKYLDENIVIQLGKEDRASIVATHFPCSCIEEGECLIISCKSEKVEEAKGQQKKEVQPRNNYSVFYIDREGGVHTKTKELFRNSAVKQYKFLCVYGEKGMTVKEAVKRDGRFIDEIDDFELSDNENPNSFTSCTQRVDKLDQKEFKICLPLNKTENDGICQKGKRENYERENNEREKRENDERENDEEEQQNLSFLTNTNMYKYQHKRGTKAISDAAQQRGISVKAVVEKSGSDTTMQIYVKLHEQFPELKELMESRFPGDSYQETLKLKKENFGKIQQSFSEVHRVRKLLMLGRSVCKVVVENVCGTAFVLFDNFIMTNAHLFKDCIDGKKLQEGKKVYALFNYDEPEPNTKYYYFSGKKTFIDFDKELDYAILELNPQGQKPNNSKKKITVPPGLLNKFGPMPLSGEACIIGHPAGGVKKMDPTCIIEKERREEAITDKIKHHGFVIHRIIQELKAQGIENIMMGGNQAEKVGTYHTSMYHGSSGSPVFDANVQVFGLHTAGFTCQKDTEHVIEVAHPLLTIFENFVRRLKEMGNEGLLNRVKEEAKGNSYLQKVFKAESDDSEPMEE